MKRVFVLSAADGLYLVNKDGTFVKTLTTNDCRWIAIDYSNVDILNIYCIKSDGDLYKVQ